MEEGLKYKYINATFIVALFAVIVDSVSHSFI